MKKIVIKEGDIVTKIKGDERKTKVELYDYGSHVSFFKFTNNFEDAIEEALDYFNKLNGREKYKLVKK